MSITHLCWLPLCLLLVNHLHAMQGQQARSNFKVPFPIDQANRLLARQILYYIGKFREVLDADTQWSEKAVYEYRNPIAIEELGKKIKPKMALEHILSAIDETAQRLPNIPGNIKILEHMFKGIPSFELQYPRSNNIYISQSARLIDCQAIVGIKDLVLVMDKTDNYKNAFCSLLTQHQRTNQENITPN